MWPTVQLVEQKRNNGALLCPTFRLTLTADLLSLRLFSGYPPQVLRRVSGTGGRGCARSTHRLESQHARCAAHSSHRPVPLPTGHARDPAPEHSLPHHPACSTGPRACDTRPTHAPQPSRPLLLSLAHSPSVVLSWQLAVSSALFRPAEPRSIGTLSCGDSPPAVTCGRHVASRHDPGGRAAPVPRALDIREARRARRAEGRAAAEAEQARPAQGVKRLPKVRQPCSQRTHLSTHSSTPPPPCPPPGR